MEEEIVELTFEERFAKFTSKAVSLAPLIAAIGIAIWWIFQGTVKIVDIELSVAQQIGLTIMTIVMALTYRKLLSVGGFDDGKKTADYKEVNTHHKKSKELGNQHRREIYEFVKDECYNNLRAVRRRNLENNGLAYESIFNELGQLIAIDYKKNKYNKKHNKNGYKRHQRHIIKKCVKMQVYIPDVFGVDNVRYFGLKKPESEKSFKTKNDSAGAIITAVLAFFSTGIMFAWIGFTLGSVIYALFQVTLWTGTGVLQRIKNYNFIVKKMIPQIEEHACYIDAYLSLSEDRKLHYQQIVIEKEERKFRKALPFYESKESVK